MLSIYCNFSDENQIDDKSPSAAATEVVALPTNNINNETNKKLAASNENFEYHTNSFFQCTVCDKLLVDENNMITHMRIHKKEKVQHSCETCGRGFTKKSDLKSHSRIHTGEKPFKCEFCGQEFRWRKAFKNHRYTHFTAHRCKTCNKTFSSKEKLKVHQMLHRVENVYKCEVCADSFETHEEIEEHLKIHKIF